MANGPPAVAVAVSRTALELALLLCFLCAGAVAVTLMWLRFSSAAGPWVGLSLLLVCGSLALRGWWCGGCGVLQWDGQNWVWRNGQQLPSANVQLISDFQTCLLVRLTLTSGKRDWLWLIPDRDLRHWRAVRRALVAVPASEGVADGSAGPRKRNAISSEA
jgi:hypothetical protein